MFGMWLQTLIRLEADILKAFRASGRGWHARMNDALKEFHKGDSAGRYLFNKS